MANFELIHPATLSFTDNHTPISTQFDDIYFNTNNGIAESLYHYPDAHDLPARWRKHFEHENAFNIGEIGFGCGLNFLLTCQRWLQHKAWHRGRHLFYLGCEKHPIPVKTLKNMYQSYDIVEDIQEQLLHDYPDPIQGYYRFEFKQFNITLILAVGDAMTMLTELAGRRQRFNCWYMDGFNPQKNPALWSKTLCNKVAELSQPSATISSFSAASMVRKNLQDAGFTIQKRKGFAKREMLYGTLSKHSQAKAQCAPWYAIHSASKPANKKEKTAIVLGAGIAGCSVAYALAKKNWHVTLVDEHQSVGQLASGNPSALVYPSISLDLNKATQLYLCASYYARQLYGQLHAHHGNIIQSQGLAFISKNESRLHKIAAIGLPTNLVNFCVPQQLAERSGLPLEYSALYFGQALTVDARAVCAALSQHENIHYVSSTTAARYGKKADGWEVQLEHQRLNSTCLILCPGAKGSKDPYLSSMGSDTVRGQLALLKANDLSEKLKCSLVFGHYLTPVHEGMHCLGASFVPGNTDTSYSATEEAQLLAQLQAFFPDLARAFTAEPPNRGRVATRFSSIDHLPLCGPLAQQNQFRSIFSDIKKGKKFDTYTEIPWQEGLFTLTALGSKGFLTAPLLSESLACVINDEIPPLNQALWQSIHPHRFDVKYLFSQQHIIDS